MKLKRTDIDHLYRNIITIIQLKTQKFNLINLFKITFDESIFENTYF